MDTSIVEVRKNFIVYANLNGINSFDFDIKISFDPDAVIVKTVNYATDADVNENGVSFVTSDLVDNDCLCSFKEPCSYYVGTIFTLKKPVNSSYNFALKNISSDDSRVGDLVLNLEFVKYKDVKSQKVL